MFKTEIHLSYQKAHGEQPYVVLTMKDFLVDGRELIRTAKVSKEAPDLYREQVTLTGNKLIDHRIETGVLRENYGDFIGGRIIGHLNRRVI